MRRSDPDRRRVGDLADSYPIPVEPTREYAEMLLSRVEFIRTEIIRLAG